MPADVTTTPRTTHRSRRHRVDVSAAPAALDDVDHEPGAAKPDPIVVADGIKRQFGGLTAVDVAHVEIQRGVDHRADRARTAPARPRSSTC